MNMNKLNLDKMQEFIDNKGGGDAVEEVVITAFLERYENYRMHFPLEEQDPFVQTEELPSYEIMEKELTTYGFDPKDFDNEALSTLAYALYKARNYITPSNNDWEFGTLVINEHQLEVLNKEGIIYRENPEFGLTVRDVEKYLKEYPLEFGSKGTNYGTQHGDYQIEVDIFRDIVVIESITKETIERLDIPYNGGNFDEK